MRVAQEPRDRRADGVELGQVADREPNEQVALALIALQARERVERDDQQVVLALSEDLALLLENAGDSEPLPVELDVLAERVLGQRQLGSHLLADHGDTPARLVVAVGDEPAMRREVLPDLLILVRRADDLRGSGLRSRSNLTLRPHDRSDRLDTIDAIANQVVVAFGEPSDAAREISLARRERRYRDAVRAEARELLADHRGEPLDDRDHRDDRGDADHDAERRQKAAEAVRANRG